MDQETLNRYFAFINLKYFCDTYNIGYQHFTEVLSGKHIMGKKLEGKIQSSILQYHDDCMEMSEILMQKPKIKNKRKGKKVLQSVK